MTTTTTTQLSKDMNTNEFLDEYHEFTRQHPIPALTCYHQRTALIKSILNYLKKPLLNRLWVIQRVISLMILYQIR
jgi:hypothetical protein